MATSYSRQWPLGSRKSEQQLPFHSWLWSPGEKSYLLQSRFSAFLWTYDLLVMGDVDCHMSVSCYLHVHCSSGYFCSECYHLRSLGCYLSVGPASLLAISELWPLCSHRALLLVSSRLGAGDLHHCWSPPVLLCRPCPDATQAFHSVATSNTMVTNDAWGHCSLHHPHLGLRHSLPADLPYPKLCSPNRDIFSPSCVPFGPPGIEFFTLPHVILSHSEETRWDSSA